MDKLTQNQLKSLLNYNSKTGIFKWKIKPARKVRIGDIAGCKCSKEYIVIRIKGIAYKAHRLAWFYIYGKWPKKRLDHKDHIRYHNWIDNLREVTQLENMQNQSIYSNNTSGFTGVYWFKRDSNWAVKIRVNKKLKHIGYFEILEDAIEARKAANIKYGFHPNHGKVKEQL